MKLSPNRKSLLVVSETAGEYYLSVYDIRNSDQSKLLSFTNITLIGIEKGFAIMQAI